jgi:hypothetical protein
MDVFRREPRYKHGTFFQIITAQLNQKPQLAVREIEI